MSGDVTWQAIEREVAKLRRAVEKLWPSARRTPTQEREISAALATLSAMGAVASRVSREHYLAVHGEIFDRVLSSYKPE